MGLRRLLIAAIAAATAAGLGDLLLQVLAPGGWTIAKLLMLAGYAGAAPWVGLCLANGLTGFLVLMTTPRRAEPPPGPDLPPLAIALTIRNEDTASVLPAAAGLLRGLTAAGVPATLFILSDTNDPRLAAAEELPERLLRRAHVPVRDQRGREMRPARQTGMSKHRAEQCISGQVHFAEPCTYPPHALVTARRLRVEGPPQSAVGRIDPQAEDVNALAAPRG